MDVYSMKLHDRIILPKDVEVMRVPGGWIYILHQHSAGCANQMTFVPFNNEFQER